MKRNWALQLWRKASRRLEDQPIEGQIQQIAEAFRINEHEVAAEQILRLIRVRSSRPSPADAEKLSYELLSAALRAPESVFEALSRVLDQGAPCNVLSDRVLTQLFDSYFRLFLKTGESNGLTDLLERYSRYSRLPGHELYKGAAANLAGDRETAFGHYANAARLASDEYGLARMYLGAYSIRERQWAQSNANGLQTISPTINWKISPSQKKALCIVLGSDTRYFKAFALDILQSFKAKRGTTAVHFHVVGWDAECEAVSASLQRLHPISLSTEPIKYVKDRAYFATSRFYRAVEIMERVGSVYITDIDNRFSANPDMLSELLADFDIGLRYTGNEKWFPWWGPSAGNVFISDRPNGWAFAKALRKYIDARFTVNNYRSWWFDQLALNEVGTYFSEISTVNLQQPRFHVCTARPYAEVAAKKRVGKS